LAKKPTKFGDNEELAGKKVEVEFEILDVKRVEASTAADLAKKLGLEEEMIRTSLKSSMENKLAYAQREQVREQISKTLTESADWELPPDLLRRQSRRELDRSVIEMQSSGFSQQEIMARENALRKNVLEKTATALKEHFILERIAEEEKIEDAPQDYEVEINRIAMQQNDTPRQYDHRRQSHCQNYRRGQIYGHRVQPEGSVRHHGSEFLRCR